MTNEEYKKLFNSLSFAQRSYIFDKKYIATNPKTKQILIEKGFLKDITTIIAERKIDYNGIMKHTTCFTEKTHEMVRYRCELMRKKQKEEFPDHIPIENDEQLLTIFQEIMLFQELSDCVIYYHRGINGFVTSNDIDYIIHPYYKWLIDIDKTSGRFLKYGPMTSAKGSYCHEYYKKGI